ncbi:unnamed protein product [Euphydryas editha]|uniref:FP protein C-terminal domain-containing protein n=1 Tax=Euphydryas editha TaxID=104508 RepID=A0AAU9V6U1_EUPED|nr:unnamed protein product [Euphydryas editha]
MRTSRVRFLNLESENKNIKEKLIILEKQIQEHQEFSRPSSIEIRNVPNNEKETVDDLMKKIKHLGSTLNLDIKDEDIRDVYRRAGKPGTPKAIIVELNSVQHKDAFLTAVRRWNKSRQGSNRLNCSHIGEPGDMRPVYVNEHLTYSTRKLFFRAREFAKEHKYEFCWISKGKVLIRKDSNSKYIHVTSELSLSKILSPIE